MNSFKAVSMIALALLAATTFSSSARADELDCLLGFQNCENGAQILQAISSSSIVLPLLSSGATTASNANRKELIAHAALEDAAVYFESGRMTGILPAAVRDIKLVLARRDGVAPEAISDAEAVEMLTKVAEHALY
jgi:hypothetical protein